MQNLKTVGYFLSWFKDVSKLLRSSKGKLSCNVTRKTCTDWRRNLTNAVTVSNRSRPRSNSRNTRSSTQTSANTSASSATNPSNNSHTSNNTSASTQVQLPPTHTNVSTQVQLPPTHTNVSYERSTCFFFWGFRFNFVQFAPRTCSLMTCSIFLGRGKGGGLKG